MLKKLTSFFVVFFILIAFNIFITLKINAKKKYIAATTALLTEIDNARNNEKLSDTSASPFVLGVYEAKIETTDARAANLRAFFRKWNSLLFDYSDYIVQTSDKYGLDYKIIPAISIQESTGCKFIPPDSRNCWGWGIYGSKITRFNSYEEAIDTVAKGLKSEYADKGLKTPQEIMRKYNPSSPDGSWAKGVSTAIGYIE